MTVMVAWCVLLFKRFALGVNNLLRRVFIAFLWEVLYNKLVMLSENRKLFWYIN